MASNTTIDKYIQTKIEICWNFREDANPIVNVLAIGWTTKIDEESLPIHNRQFPAILSFEIPFTKEMNMKSAINGKKCHR